MHLHDDDWTSESLPHINAYTSNDRMSHCHDTRKLELGFDQLSHICDAHALDDDRTSSCHDTRKLELGFDQLSHICDAHALDNDRTSRCLQTSSN